MLVVLSDSLLDVDFAQRESLWALDHLLRAGGDGNHYLFASRSVLHEIGSIPGLSSISRGVLKRMHSEYQDRASIFHFVTERIHVTSDGEFTGCDDNGVWNVPLCTFRDLNLDRETHLLVEDLLDGEFWRLTTEALVFKNRLKGVRVRARSVNGGGSRLGDVVAQSANENICLVICDSDKYGPNSGVGQTGRDAEGASLGSQTVLRYVRNDDYREVENMVPLRLFGCAEPTFDIDIIDKVARIRAVATAVSNFLDLKQGTVLGWIGASVHAADRDIWHRDMTRCCGQGVVHFECDLPDGICQTVEDCTCHVFQGLGQNVLQRIVDGLSGMTKQKRAECIGNPEESPGWQNVASHVLNFCIAEKKLVS